MRTRLKEVKGNAIALSPMDEEDQRDYFTTE